MRFLKKLSGFLPRKMEGGHFGHALKFRFSLPTRHFFHAEKDRDRNDEAKSAGDVENVTPAQPRRDHQRQDHPEQVTNRLRQLQQAVNFATQVRAEIIRDQSVQTGIR